MLPQGILANFFLQLNNAKISSSRNNVIWAKDLQNTGTLEELRSNLAFSCPEFAPPRNYQSTNLRITNMDRAARDGILASASSEPFHILQETVKALANPAAFSVESLLDTIEKWNRYASKMKESCIKSNGRLGSRGVSLAIGRSFGPCRLRRERLL